MNVLVVIVNYKSAGLAIDCLKTLEPEIASVPGSRVALVENCSGDGSTERLREAIQGNGWGGWVDLLPQGVNGGFAAGNNAAIRPALASNDPPRYVWLLNPDTLVRPGAMRALVDFLDANPGAGVAGSRMEERDGRPQPSFFRFPSVLGELEGTARMRVVTRALARWAAPQKPPEVPTPIDWVSGASLIVRREVFGAVGLLDEGYFMYFEEVDFCRRARDAGWPCWYVPSARVVHLIGQSSGVTNLETIHLKRRPRYWFEARRRYHLRHLGRGGTLLSDLAWAFGYAFFRVRRSVLRDPVSEPPWLWWDFVRFNFNPRPAGP